MAGADEAAAGGGEASYQPLPDAEDLVSLTFRDGTLKVERPVLEKMEYFTALLGGDATWAESEACAEGRPIHLGQDLGAFPLLCAYVRDGVLDLSEGAVEEDGHIAQLCEQADYFGVPDLVARLRPVLDSHRGIDQNVLDYMAEAGMPMAFAGETLANLGFPVQRAVENVTFEDALMHRVAFRAACQHCEFARAHASLVRFHAVDQCDFERARLYGCAFGPEPRADSGGAPDSSSHGGDASATSGAQASTNGTTTPAPSRRTGSLNDVAAMRTGSLEDASACVAHGPRWYSDAPNRTRSYPLLQLAAGAPAAAGDGADRRVGSHRGPLAPLVTDTRGGHPHPHHSGTLPPVASTHDREPASGRWRHSRVQVESPHTRADRGREGRAPSRDYGAGDVRELSSPQRVVIPPPPLPHMSPSAQQQHQQQQAATPDTAFVHRSSFVRVLLRGCHFGSLQLRGTVDFSSSRLVHCVFSPALRREARSSLILRRATVVGGVVPPLTSRDDLQGAVLRDVALQGTIEDVDFTVLGADGLLTGVDFRGCTLRRCSFRGLTLRRCAMDGVALHSCALQRATLDACSLQGASVGGSSAAGTTLRGCDLRCLRGAAGVDWSGASLTSCSLQGLDLRGAALRDVAFRACSLNCTSVAGADVTGTSFEDCCTTNLDADGVTGASPGLAKLFAQCMCPRRRRSSSVDARVVRNAVNALVTEAGGADALSPQSRGALAAPGLRSDGGGGIAAASSDDNNGVAAGSEGGAGTWAAAPGPMPPPDSVPPPQAQQSAGGREDPPQSQQETEAGRTTARRRWQWAARQRSWLTRRAVLVSRRDGLNTSASSSAFRTESDPAAGAVFQSRVSVGRSAHGGEERRAAAGRGEGRTTPR